MTKGNTSGEEEIFEIEMIEIEGAVVREKRMRGSCFWEMPGDCLATSSVCSTGMQQIRARRLRKIYDDLR